MCAHVATMYIIAICFSAYDTTEVRCAESAKIRGKYQDRIPVGWCKISKKDLSLSQEWTVSREQD